MERIKDDAFYRTDFLTLRGIKMSYTFSAFIGVDFVIEGALANRLVRTLTLADIAVDTLIGNGQCHLKYLGLSF